MKTVDTFTRALQIAKFWHEFNAVPLFLMALVLDASSPPGKWGEKAKKKKKKIWVHPRVFHTYFFCSCKEYHLRTEITGVHGVAIAALLRGSEGEAAVFLRRWVEHTLPPVHFSIHGGTGQ